jgi:glycosyltransferase involved in cell wall biosynthesis
MKRILHVVNNLNFGGMERIIAELFRRTDRSRFELHLLVLSYLGHFSQGLEQYGTLHVATSAGRWSMIYPGGIAAQIRAIAPDVVHSHSGVWYKTSRAARMAGVPYVMHTDHGRRTPDPWLHRQIDRMASRRTDIVVAVSDVLARQLAGVVADPGRIRMIRNGVDTDIYTPRPYDGALHRELGLDPDVPLIGSIGRLEPIKGYEIAVEAMARLVHTWELPRRPVLVLIGDGSQREALQRQASTANLGEAIRFLGWRSDIEACLSAFTMFTMSSHSEGTSVSLLEAMSSGLCPVVTRVGGNPAVLGTPLTHRLVPAGDSAALAAAWRETLQSPDRRVVDALAARQRVMDDFGLDAMVRSYEAAYELAPNRDATPEHASTTSAP